MLYDKLQNNDVCIDTIDSQLIKANIEEIENELRILRNQNIEGIILRSKSRWKVAGERGSKYFFNLEKRHFREKLIPKLYDKEGKELTLINKIITEQEFFFRDLYNRKETVFHDIHQELFFDNGNPYIRKLNN